MNTLGINDGHNASACLLINGEIRYCIQEERLTNIKNYMGFPFKSINRILQLSNLSPEEIDIVAMASVHLSVPQNVNALLSKFRERAKFKVKIKRHFKRTPLFLLYKAVKREERLKCIDKAGFQRKKVIFVDHHLCHAAAAYYGSPWKDEKVLVLTCDGEGDFICSTVNIGENGTLTRIAATNQDNSVGELYSVVTFMMGLVPYEHEYKIMGLAPYASSKRAEKCFEIFQSYLEVSRNDSLTFKRKINEPTNLIYSRLKKDLEFQRFDWIAGGLQKFTEEIFCEWVKNCIRKTGIRKLVLSGGVCMNVKTNKRIMELDEVDSMFVLPSCSDESISIGAAFHTYMQYCKEHGIKVNIPPLKEIYYGPSFTDSQVEDIIKKYKNKLKFDYEYIDDIEKMIAELLIKGEIVARCKGRMEFGARALGNRSILTDASDLKCTRTINMMIKCRDFWMPFAPVILKEREHDYIINPKNIASPYMILSFDTTDNRKDLIAAIHQADFTARPQVIEKDFNPDYYKILEEFEKSTGKGALLNTSFNLHGYPIVLGPEEAMWVFENSGLEYLALGNYLLFNVKGRKRIE